MAQTDIMLGVGVIAILVVLILPLPAVLLDLLLALSITFSVLILLTALLIERPLDFNAFPTVLLLATMLRLSLNLASTRLILAQGHEGPDAAGHVIEAFGSFIMQGNIVIGVIVFGILVIVNFVVITKGSGRIAEVAARFSLDAMPGKQMAIDADLSAGLIDEATARTRRRELEEESAFFGAMDGSAKFVRGDAVAGLLITAINLVGGLVIGVGQMGVSFGEALHTYTLLTVGDGLVSQIPALIVSTAAGLLVSKAGVTGRADLALTSQLGAHPKALAVTAGLLGTLAILPGLPALPFLILAGGTGGACLARTPAQEGRGCGQGRRRCSGTTCRGADRHGTRHGRASGRARLRPPGPDRRRPRCPPAGPDQGAAPAVGRRARLRDAVGADPGQHPAPGQHLRHPDQGDGGRPRRHPAVDAAGHGSARQARSSAGRGDGRAHLRAQCHVGDAGPARGGDDQGLHGGRPGHRGDHPPDRARP